MRAQTYEPQLSVRLCRGLLPADPDLALLIVSQHVRKEHEGAVFAVGEFWKDDVDSLCQYLEDMKVQFSLFDTPWVPLSHLVASLTPWADFTTSMSALKLPVASFTHEPLRLFQLGEAGKDADLRQVFDDTLVQRRPTDAVTFIDNHDSQPGQESSLPLQFLTSCLEQVMCADQRKFRITRL